MNYFTGVLMASLIAGTYTQTTIAQERDTYTLPLPSLEDFTKGENGWAFGLGLGVEYEAAYEGSDEYEFEVDPTGAVQWRNDDDLFYWAGEALGWRGVRHGTWLFEAILSFDEGREENASDKGHLDGLGDGDETTEAVLQVRRAFDEDWRYWLDARVVTGSEGSIGLLGIGRRFGGKHDGTGHEIALATVFHSSSFANKDFGIDARQSNASGLDETRLSSGFRSIGFNYHYRHHIDEHWQIFGEAVYEHYGSEVAKSPITRENYEAEIGIGFIYIF